MGQKNGKQLGSYTELIQNDKNQILGVQMSKEKASFVYAKKKELNSNSKHLLDLSNDLREKISKILNRPNDPELEQEYIKTRLCYKNNPSIYESSLMQAYTNAYKQKASLYNIVNNKRRTNLFIYNTENHKKEVKDLKTPKILDFSTCIAQLPNGKLFCFGRIEPKSGTAMLIDLNGEIKFLPSGTRCGYSSAIYLNNNVYCFGGAESIRHLNLSTRFDFGENRWIKLTPMPSPDLWCSSVIFLGNILFSGYKNRKLFLYSIDIDSFSIIRWDFGKFITKILVKAEERLYLIQSKNFQIYESEIASFNVWKIVTVSTINIIPNQIYCSYNRGAIYIGCNSCDSINYYKFDLNKKTLVSLK